ncbi:PepSY domain-containing protein [Sporosarcina highlanderae]|uniref:PepSY domain-containing protein n=1 Tax=Sporosarcina highlanderae TaxID=3035916 RepID=A0ABT8JPT1_9BACL|nr:PepSY domain-containing protein [Sporosarcina highlanderae]MDN4606194.1 PepSY domain-containing protein [Sporosarcina highlanderae]
MKKWMLVPALAGVLAIGGVALANDSVSSTEAAKNQLITLKKAKEVALQKVDGIITDVELEKDDNRYYYDIELQDDKFEYDVEVDAVTGEIIKFEKEYDDDENHVQTGEKQDVTSVSEQDRKKGKLSKEQVLAIAKQHASGEVTDFELDDYKYEIEMRDGNTEYDLEIHAYSGVILSFEMDEG